jgi:hypothetical protein
MLPVQTKRTLFTGQNAQQTRLPKLEANLSKSISDGPKGVVSSVICGFSQWRIAVIVTTVPSLSSK